MQALGLRRDGHCAYRILAASDTTTSALHIFVLAMLYAPEVQKRAQQELDGITGGHRLPEFSDRTSLPYIDAVVKESLRWQSVVPLGLPHVARVDGVGRSVSSPHRPLSSFH